MLIGGGRMTTLCVDASIAPKWWFPEVHSAEAELLRIGDFELIAPALLPIELASVFVHKFRRHQISEEQLARFSVEIARTPVRIFDAGTALAAAIDLAARYHPSLYGCLYAALALRERCQVVTADRRFYDALSKPFPQTMLWIADLPALARRTSG